MVSYIMHKPGQSTLQSDIEMAASFFNSGCRRKSTADFHLHAIRDAITLMHEQFAEPLTLQDMADAAQISPFHFNRVFHRNTGLPPTIFLSSIRLQQAKYLLMTTKDTVTSICFDVGYRSLGTFTSRFAALVGLPPSHYRQLLDEDRVYLRPADIWDSILAFARQQENMVMPRSPGVVSGTVSIKGPCQGPILIGLFTSPLPQGMPVSCTILTSPGHFTMPPVVDGQYYLFAAVLDRSQSFLNTIIYGFDLHGSTGHHPLIISNGKVKSHIDVTIAPATWLHPPILTALPWLLLCQLADVPYSRQTG